MGNIHEVWVDWNHTRFNSGLCNKTGSRYGKIMVSQGICSRFPNVKEFNLLLGNQSKILILWDLTSKVRH